MKRLLSKATDKIKDRVRTGTLYRKRLRTIWNISMPITFLSQVLVFFIICISLYYLLPITSEIITSITNHAFKFMNMKSRDFLDYVIGVPALIFLILDFLFGISLILYALCCYVCIKIGRFVFHVYYDWVCHKITQNSYPVWPGIVTTIILMFLYYIYFGAYGSDFSLISLLYITTTVVLITLFGFITNFKSKVN
ncbi:hypothetical protein N473_20925 [Pseudoalteromonas luteoviolacea CPMOR-1]|uniref:Uncharacterized protein n=1 Tax=Pseudoalteromonas luteoviolacea CPMOR-1 TaxID=1365248 RepID=A0A167K248_9GAMM|nr:hypothetical protein N473_20925 [Pseudoalteromonas luteoviolacea CPMOR-1]